MTEEELRIKELTSAPVKHDAHYMPESIRTK